MIRYVVAGTLVSGLLLPSVAAAGPTLCSPSEEVQFSCVIEPGARIASVCSAPARGQGSAYLQYRFGQPGALEMEYPQDRQRSVERFRLDLRHHLDVNTSELSFVNGEFRYSVFVAEDQDGIRASIETVAEGGSEVVLHCEPGAQSRLAWLTVQVPQGGDE